MIVTSTELQDQWDLRGPLELNQTTFLHICTQQFHHLKISEQEIKIAKSTEAY